MVEMLDPARISPMKSKFIIIANCLEGIRRRVLVNSTTSILETIRGVMDESCRSERFMLNMAIGLQASDRRSIMIGLRSECAVYKKKQRPRFGEMHSHLEPQGFRKVQKHKLSNHRNALFELPLTAFEL